MLRKNNYLLILLILFCSFNSMGSNFSGLGDCFKELYRRLSSQATPKIAALSIDSTDVVFQELLRKNSPIVKLFRVNSNGIIINESTKNNSNHVMRNISGQQWFTQVHRSAQPYFGITRDSAGPAFLFWVWPLKNANEQFAGAMAAKIDPAEIIRFVDEQNTIPLKLEVNGSPVFANNWQNYQNIESVSWTISEFLVISCYYKSAKPKPQVVLSKEAESNITVSSAEPEPIKEDLPGNSTDVKLKKQNGRSVFRSFLLIILFSSLAVILFFRIGKRWLPAKKISSLKKRTEKSISDAGDFEEVMDLVDDNLSNTRERFQALSEEENSAEVAEEIHEEKEQTEEPETKNLISPEAFYNQKKDEIFRNAQPHFRPVQSMDQTDLELSRIKNELYREIHGQIIHWVVCESARLSNCLEELTGRINRLVGSEDSPELESIREDALRISREIEIFKNSFSDSKE